MVIIKKGSISWDIGNAPHGKFGNGDYYVVGKCLVTTETSPIPNKNGHMLNPTVSRRQGFDIDMFDKFAGSYFDSTLNVEGVVEMNPGDSLFSSKSYPTKNRPQLKEIQILTCLEDHPAPDQFRSSYRLAVTSHSKFKKSDIDYSRLLNLDIEIPNSVITEILEATKNPWVDLPSGWLARYMHPTNNMPDYGTEMCEMIGLGWLAANSLHVPLTTKRHIVENLVQIGIDLWETMNIGQVWNADGGHNSGRKAAIMFAGYLLGNAQMLADTKLGAFGEDQQTFFNSEGVADWQIIPNREDISYYGSSYRRCCTAIAWTAQTILARLWGLEAFWSTAYFDYMDRYVATAGSNYKFINDLFEELWTKYRVKCQDMTDSESRTNKLYVNTFNKGRGMTIAYYDTAPKDIFNVYLVQGTKGTFKYKDITLDLTDKEPYFVDQLDLQPTYPDRTDSLQFYKKIDMMLGFPGAQVTYQVLSIYKDGTIRVSNSVTIKNPESKLP